MIFKPGSIVVRDRSTERSQLFEVVTSQWNRVELRRNGRVVVMEAYRGGWRKGATVYQLREASEKEVEYFRGKESKVTEASSHA